MKSIILSIAIFSVFSIKGQNLFSEKIPWYSGTDYFAHWSSQVKWNAANKTFKWDGNEWKRIKTILAGHEGDLIFATGNYWSGAWPTNSFDENNECTQENFVNAFGSMIIDRNSRVGIGNTAPNATLHVNEKRNKAEGMILSNSLQNRGLYFHNGKSSWDGHRNYIKKGEDFGIIWTDNFSSDGNNINAGFVLAPQSKDGQVKGLRMDSQGRVGLGCSPSYSSNANYRLSVNGKVRAKEIRVQLSWADYVFDEKYELMPLANVKNFISREGHLPNVPSSEEVENGDIGMGELMKVQQEKIEELMLYILQQEERLQKLEALLLK